MKMNNMYLAYITYIQLRNAFLQVKGKESHSTIYIRGSCLGVEGFFGSEGESTK